MTIIEVTSNTKAQTSWILSVASLHLDGFLFVTACFSLEYASSIAKVMIETTEPNTRIML